MSILTWIEDKKRFKVLNAPKHINVSSDSTKGLWTRCDKCGVILYIKHLKDNQRVCFGCSYHLQMMSQERIENLLDKIPFVTEQPLRGSTKKGASLSTFGAFGEFARKDNSPEPKSGPIQKIEDLYATRAGKRGFAQKNRSLEQNQSTRKLCTSGTFGEFGDNISFIDSLSKGDTSRPFVTKQSSDSRLQESPPSPKGSERFVPQPLPQKERENMISTWRPLDETVSPCDPLKFADQKKYTDRLQDAQGRTGLQDAIQTGTGMIDGIPVALAVMDFSFMGGSMGSVVGEKITRLIEYATQEGLTLIIVSASGGARMQEGVFSLMQMAKISSSLQIYQSCANLLYISILTSPTTGGVTASFAMLGDIIFAEPKALIAFAGRRVIEQTLREDLPDDFQTSEYMLHHGLVDLIVPRRFLRQALSESIKLYQNAPFKKRGRIPFGVQNPITFITEEKIRRQWGLLTKKGTKEVYSEGTDLYSFASGANSYKKKLCTLSALSEKSQSPECLAVQLPQMHQCTSLQDKAPRSIAKQRISSGSCKLKSVIAPKRTSKIFARRGKFCKQDSGTKLRFVPRSMCKFKRCITRGKFTNKTPLRLLQMHKGGLQANVWSQSKKALLFQRSLKLTHERANLLTRQQSLYKSLICKALYHIESANLNKAPLCTRFVLVPKKGGAFNQINSEDSRKGANLYSATFVTKERPLKMTEDTQYREILTSFKIMLHLFSSQIGGNTPKSDPVFVPPLYALGTNVLEGELSSKAKGSKQSSLKTKSDKSSRFTNPLLNFSKAGTKQSFLEMQLYKSGRFIKHQRYKGECILKDANNLRFAKKEQPENKVKPPVFLQNGAFQKSHTKKFQNDIKKPLPESTILDFTTRSTRNGLQARHIRASFLTSLKAEAEKSSSYNRTSVQKVMHPLGYKERKESRFAETNQKSDINLLNQAIELAATESVEWRAFYIDQQLSENMGFLDNFLQDRKNQPIKNNNILFYKSICRISSGL